MGTDEGGTTERAIQTTGRYTWALQPAHAAEALLHHVPAEWNVRQHVPGQRQQLENEAYHNGPNATTGAETLNCGKHNGQYEEQKVPAGNRGVG